MGQVRSEIAKNKKAYFIFELRDELLVTWQDVGAVLDQTAQCPQPQRRFAVFFHDVEMWPVRSAAHLSGLLNYGVYTLVEGII